MNKQWLEFCRKFKEKLKNDEILDGKSFVEYVTRRYTTRIVFKVAIEEISSSHLYENMCFTLDTEDLNYLYAKYSNKLGEELELEKQKLDVEYEQATKLYTTKDASK